MNHRVTAESRVQEDNFNRGSRMHVESLPADCVAKKENSKPATVDVLRIEQKIRSLVEIAADISCTRVAQISAARVSLVHEQDQ